MTTPVRDMTKRPLGFYTLIGCTIGLVVALIMAWDMALALQLLAASVAFVVYLRYGRVSISATSVLFLSLAMFSGLTGVWLSILGLQGDEGAAVRVGLGLFVGTVLAGAVAALVRNRHRDGRVGVTGPIRASEAREVFVVGVALIVSSVVLGRLDSVGPLSAAFAYLGVLAFGIGAARQFSENPRSLWTALFAVLTGTALTYYLVFVFQGFGRIVIAELALGLLIIWSLNRPSSAYRWFVGVGIVLAIVLGSVAGIVRSTGGSLTEAWDAVVTSSAVLRGDIGGLASVYAPLQNTAILVELRDSYDQSVVEWRIGRTYVNALLVPIPRTVWPDKPVQLNSDIVATLSPDLAGTEHSEAVGAWGEAFLNFGLLGIIAIPAVAAYLAAIGDNWYERHVDSPGSSNRDLVLLAFASTASGIPDLVWGGSETFSSRAGVRLIILGAIYLVSRSITSREKPPSSAFPVYDHS